MASLTQNFAGAVKTILEADLSRRTLATAEDPLLRLFKPQYDNTDKVFWDMEENSYGLMPLRGLGAKPDVVRDTGWKRYTADPAYLGQTMLLEEGEITKGVEPGTLAEPIQVGNRLTRYARSTAKRILDRMRKWDADLAITGQIDHQDDNGRRFQYQLSGYANQKKVPGTPWFTNASTAQPIQDFLGWQAALERGTDSRFGADSFLLANSFTIAEFFGIAQIIGTYKTDYGATINGLEAFNKALASKQGFSLPQIVRYNDGYYPTEADALAGTNWTYFIPNRTFIWIGTRPEGDPIARFQLTRHAGLEADGPDFDGVNVRDENPTDIGKGLYVNCHWNNRQPHGYELEAGLNGLPVLFRPSAVASITYT